MLPPLHHSPDTSQSLIVAVHWGHHIWCRCVPRQPEPPAKSFNQLAGLSVRTLGHREFLGSGWNWDTVYILAQRSKPILTKSHDFRAHWAWPSILLPSMLRMMLEQWHKNISSIA